MLLTVEQFNQRLTSSGVMSEDELRDWIAAVPVERRPQDGESLAKALVKDKRLTKFQAEQIYAGKEKSLTLGNYVILDKLGQGGMGMVLKAQHKRMARVVALKVMSPAAVKSPDAVKRFHREVQTAAKLTHPNIVTAFDADEAKGTHFLVMEYVEGDDLSQLVKKHGALSVEQAIECIIQAARGLAHAHAEGVIHRDIKPANLLLDKHGVVKILDMGLARLESGLSDAAGVEGAGLTQSGTIMGTVDYMSPEQAEDTRHADARSDIYSLGCSLYYLLTGQAVYGGETMMKKLLAHRDAPLPSLADECRRLGLCPDPSSSRQGRDRVPTYEQLDAIFHKMIAKRTADRYQSMGEVIADLERCRAGESVTMNVNAVSGEAGSNYELQKFLRQISGDEGSQVTGATSAGPFGGASADGNAETVFTTNNSAGTDPQTEMTLATERSRRLGDANKTRNVSLTAIAIVGLLLGSWWVFGMPRGSMQVEITDEQIEVTFGETGRTLHGPANETLKLPIGEHVLHVRVGETQLDTPEITVAKGEPVEIKVERVGNRVRVMRGKEFLVAKELPRSKASEKTVATTGGTAVIADGGKAAWELEFNGSTRSRVDIPTLHTGRLRELTLEGFFTAMKLQHHQDGYWLGTKNGTRLFNPANGTGITASFGSSPKGYVHLEAKNYDLPIGKVVHVAAVWDGRVARIFVDGNLVASQPVEGRKHGHTTSFDYNIGSTFAGRIHEVRVSKTARYSENFSPSQRFTPDADTVALYHFDEGNGEVLKDSSGNNHHGKIVGAKWVKTAVERSSPFDQLRKADIPVAAIKQVFADKPPPSELVGLVPASLRDGKPSTFNHLGVASDGTRFVLAGHPPPVRVFESATVKPVTTLNMPHILNTRFLEDGRSLAMVSSGGGFHHLDLTTATQEVKNYPKTTQPSDTSVFTSDGRQVFIGHRDGVVRHIETATGRLLDEFQRSTQKVRALRFSPDERRLYMLFAGQGASGTILVTRDLASGKDSTFELGEGALLGRDYSWFLVHPDEKSLWFADIYMSIIVRFDLVTQTRLPDIKLDELWRGHAIRNDGRQFVTAGPSGKLKVWDATTLQVTREIALPPNDAGYCLVEYAPDGRHLIVGHHDPGNVFVLRLEAEAARANTATDNVSQAAVTKITPHEKFPVLKGHEGPIYRIRFLPDGKQVVSVARDGTARLWNVETGEMVRTFASTGSDKTLNNLAVSPDGRLLALGGSIYRVYLFDIATGKSERIITLKEKDQPAVGGLAFSADGQSLFVGNAPGLLQEFRVADGTPLSAPKLFDQRVMSIVPLPDNERLLVGAWSEQSFVLWNRKSQQVEQRFAWTEKYQSPRSIKLLADGDRVASTHDNNLVRIWSLKTGAELKRWPAHPGKALAATDVITLHNDRWLLTLGDDKTIRLWDGTTFEKLDEATTEMLATGQGAVSPDGRTLVTGAGWRLTTQSEYDGHHDLHVWRLPMPLAAANNATTFTNTLGMEFVRVPKGKSWLGGGGGKPGTKDVEFKDDFYLGKFEVTQGEWELVMDGSRPSYFLPGAAGGELVKEMTDAERKRLPVENVSWDHAQEFLKRLNEKAKDSGWQYRLPTEAEWEYAARGGPLSNQAESAFDFYFDQPTNVLLATHANSGLTNLKRTCPVGGYAPNRLGLHDLFGNVREWCLDEEQHPGDKTWRRVVRGGGWNLQPDICRAGRHDSGIPTSSSSRGGLRVARVRATAQTAAWQSLFNGKDLSGWIGDPKRFSVVNGELKPTGGSKDGPGQWLDTQRAFGDFTLKAQVWVDGNSGIRLRSAMTSVTAEITPGKDNGGTWAMGRFDTPDTRSRVPTGNSFRPREWNDFELTRQGTTVSLRLNGEAFNAADPKSLPLLAQLTGPVVIGLESYDGSIGFRDIRIQEHSPPPVVSWQPLFNGKDLTGFKQRAADGIAEVVVDGQPFLRLQDKSHLTTRRFGDCHLRLQCRMEKGARIAVVSDNNPRLTVNLEGDLSKANLHAVEMTFEPATIQNGRFVGNGQVIDSQKIPLSDPRSRLLFSEATLNANTPWQTLEIIHLGDSCAVLFNGQLAAAATNIRITRPGEPAKAPGQTEIGLTAYGGPASYRNIELREITSLPPEIAP